MVAVRRSEWRAGKVRAPEGRLPGNSWAPRGDGKGHREQTALYPRVRVKRWGKSPPRAWQQAWHGNPQSEQGQVSRDRKSTRLNSSHSQISYAVFCLKKKTNNTHRA